MSKITNWEREFKKRMAAFEGRVNTGGDGVSLSIKLRVIGGCFHREHSPYAYKLIDDYLDEKYGSQPRLFFQEHESGPEILVHLALVTASIQLSAAVVDLVSTIIKAYLEGAKKGDRRDTSLELIVRNYSGKGKVKEEKVVRVDLESQFSKGELEGSLQKAVDDFVPKIKNRKNKSK